MAVAVAASANPFEDTPTPPEGRWNSGRESIQEEEHMTSAASDQIYCFKCRSKTDTLEAQEVTGGSERLCCAAVACNPGQAG